MRIDTAVLLILFGALTGINLISNTLPGHDAFYQYQYFNIFYSDYYFHSELTQWLPYGSFGLPALPFDLVSITPPMYLLAIIGKWFGITNAFLLYKLSCIILIAIYSYGFYLLLNTLKINTVIRFITILSAFSTLTWHWQPYWITLLIYMIPLLLFCLVKLDQTLQVKWLYYFLLLFLVNTIGSMTYQAILQGYVLLLFFIILVITNRKLFKKIFSSEVWKTKYLLFSLPLIVIFGPLFHAILTDFINISPGRINFDAPSSIFLSYGFIPIGNIIYGFITGTIYAADNSYYIGLLPLIMCIIGIIYNRERFFLSALACIIFLVWLSFFGVFARVVYHFPAMKYYRHLGLTYHLTGTFILLCCALTLQWIYNKAQISLQNLKFSFQSLPNQTLTICIAIFMFIDFLLGNFYFLNHIFHHTYLFTVPKRAWPKFIFSLLTLRLILFGICGTWFYLGVKNNFLNIKKFFIFLALITSVDVVSFDLAKNHFLSLNFSKMPEVAQHIYPLQYQYQRNDQTSTLDAVNQQRWNFVTKQLLLANDSLGETSATYSQTNYLFSSFDPCWPQYRLDLIAPSINQLFKKIAQHSNDHILQNLIACHSSKLQLEDQPESEFNILSFTPEQLKLDLINPFPINKKLSYSDAAFPGWKVRIDAKDAALLTTSDGFKAVEIPPGKHTVQFSFSNKLYELLSYALAMISLGFFAFLFAFFRPNESLNK